MSREWEFSWARNLNKELKMANSIGKVCALSPTDALRQVLEVSGSDLKEVFRDFQPGARNQVRVVAAWWMFVATGLTRFEVAERLGISQSGVGRAIRIVGSESIRRPNSAIVAWSSRLLAQSRR